jgi:hypothetical protein
VAWRLRRQSQSVLRGYGSWPWSSFPALRLMWHTACSCFPGCPPRAASAALAHAAALCWPLLQGLRR